MEGVIDSDLADSVFVGHLHAAIHRGDGDSLTEFLVGIPDLGGLEARVHDFDLCSWNAAPFFRAKKMIEVEGFEGIVGPDSVTGGILTDFSGNGGFRSRVSASLVGCLYQNIMFLCWNNVEFAHNSMIKKVNIVRQKARAKGRGLEIEVLF